MAARASASSERLNINSGNVLLFFLRPYIFLFYLSLTGGKRNNRTFAAVFYLLRLHLSRFAYSGLLSYVHRYLFLQLRLSHPSLILVGHPSTFFPDSLADRITHLIHHYSIRKFIIDRAVFIVHSITLFSHISLKLLNMYRIHALQILQISQDKISLRLGRFPLSTSVSIKHIRCLGLTYRFIRIFPLLLHSCHHSLLFVIHNHSMRLYLKGSFRFHFKEK